MSSRDDWLVGGDRRSVASDRIYAAATDLIARDGLDAFDIDALAKRVHCSRATVYRYAGGKAEIRDAVLARVALRIVDSVRETVADLTGPERVVTAITVASELDPVRLPGSTADQFDQGRAGNSLARRIADGGRLRHRSHWTRPS